MIRPFSLGLLLLMSGCTSLPCDDPLSQDPCHADRLLLQNDMLQAKMIIASGDLPNYDLAKALLDRVSGQDQRGDADFYRALLIIHEGPQVDEVLTLLERSAAAGSPHATALLYKMYAEPYLLSHGDPLRAEGYRAAYAELDVAKSGYPSFQQALGLVNRLVVSAISQGHLTQDAEQAAQN
ncbi:MAG: hypothetical protein ABWY06_16330 [Pseudomonas sp.]|uniref:hypothetical protein n=1 Tax=Pseudomonas sp. TaxID=306 RepID=UPI0033973973